MAQKFLTSIDLTRNELQNAKIQNLASAPSSPGSGSIYFDTTLVKLRYFDGTQWNSLDTGAAVSASYALSSSFASSALTANVANTASYYGGSVVSASYAANAGNSDKLNNLSGSYYLSRTNHTGTQLSTTISDFDSQVRTSRLDQMAVPSTSVSMNSQRIINLGTPSGGSDAATKDYVDSTAQGLDVKASVRVASTGNVTIATGGLLTVDGITLSSGDRVLLKDQTAGSENGIYIAASGAWSRASDADTSTKVTTGLFTFVEQGTISSGRGYVLTTAGPITLGTTSLVFTQFSGAGTYTAGTGITLSGSQFAIDAASGYGVRKVSASIGDGSSISFVITHNLNTQDIIVSVHETASAFAVVFTDVEITSVNTITVRFTNAPSSNQYRVVIIG